MGRVWAGWTWTQLDMVLFNSPLFLFSRNYHTNTIFFSLKQFCREYPHSTVKHILTKSSFIVSSLNILVGEISGLVNKVWGIYTEAEPSKIINGKHFIPFWDLYQISSSYLRSALFIVNFSWWCIFCELHDIAAGTYYP